MLRNYLTIAYRNLRRQKTYTLINIGGLAVGLAACLLIGLWVRHQLSYDEFHEAAERTYRIMLEIKMQGTDVEGPISAAPLARTLVREFPEVTMATRFDGPFTVTVRVGDRSFVEERYFFADTSFFEVFSFPLVKGNPETVLDASDAVVLTEPTAQKYFGDANPVGKTLTINGVTRRVTGVARGVPSNSHFQFDLVASDRLSEQQETLWATNNYYTYFRLKEGASVTAFEEKLDDFVKRRVLPQAGETLGIPVSEAFSQDGYFRYSAQPLTRIHLYSNTDFEIEPNGSIMYVWIFSLIAIFILLIACANFMNLATARSAERATEVGMRKVVGARRGQLAAQFFGESMVMALGAFVLALGLAQAALPFFNDLAGTDLAMGRLLSGSVLLGAAGLMVLVGLLAGSYPAVMLSGFRPTDVLKGGDRRRTGEHGSRLRRGLVIAQFAISIGLIAGMFVVREQFNYIQQKRLGLSKERVVVVDRAWTLGEQQNAFLEQVRQQPGVVQASAGDELFEDSISETVLFLQGRPRSRPFSANYLETGFHFVETMDIEVVAGRSFSPGRRTDSTAIMLNEAAVDELGWEDPVGKTFQNAFRGMEGEVIGVVENFHYQSLRHEIQPLVLLPDASPSQFYVRLKPGNLNETLDQVRATWNRFAPNEPFRYAFLDQHYDAVHRSTQRAAQLFIIFSMLAIFIACLGLFGLAAYAAERRTKEIGIRKVLGASVSSIVVLLSKDFLKLVGIAFVIATPVAYYAMQRWLQGFAYQIELGSWVFIGAGALALVIALAAVSYQAIKAALADPVEALRYE